MLRIGFKRSIHPNHFIFNDDPAMQIEGNGGFFVSSRQLALPYSLRMTPDVTYPLRPGRRRFPPPAPASRAAGCTATAGCPSAPPLPGGARGGGGAGRGG